MWVELLVFWKDLKLPVRWEEGFNLLQEYRQGFSLNKIVISARLSCVFPGFLICSDSAHNYLNIRVVFLQFLCGFRAVQSRHTDVHEYQSYIMFIDEFNALLATAHNSNQINIFLGLKVRLNSFAKQITIVSDECECSNSMPRHSDTIPMEKHL